MMSTCAVISDMQISVDFATSALSLELIRKAAYCSGSIQQMILIVLKLVYLSLISLKCVDIWSS